MRSGAADSTIYAVNGVAATLTTDATIAPPNCVSLLRREAKHLDPLGARRRTGACSILVCDGRAA